jgi:diguanylate cyclase (GGDEF)-like protein/PAS domain S-box-containing protein
MEQAHDPQPGTTPYADGAVAGAQRASGMLVPALDDLPAPSASHTEPDLGVSPERLRFEQEHAWFNELYLLAPLGYFVIGFDSAILQVNIAGAEMLGIDRQQRSQRSFRCYISQHFWADFDAFLSRALNSPTPEQCRVQMHRGAPGTEFQVTLMGSADGSGQACRLMVEPALGRNDAVEKNEERFRRIVHTAEEGIWEIDAAARTSFVNPKMARMMGYSIEEMLGQPLVTFMDDEGRILLERNIARREQGISERHEFKFLRKDGSDLWTTMATNPIFDGQGQYIGALALVTDITDRKQSSELIWRQANYDDLTSLPNRHMFMDRLAQESKKADRRSGCLGLLFIDLDHFKEVNDRMGHAAGDALLVDAARRISSCVRSSDTLARLGGDEFTVILAGLDNADSVERIAQSIISALSRPFELDAGAAYISASVGVAIYPADAGTMTELLEHADQAMYAAKTAGRNRYAFYTADLQDAATARHAIAMDLQAAVAAEQFEVLYQPIISLKTGKVHKAEALVRWRHPTRGLLEPADFLCNAEASGLIVDIGDSAFQVAAQQVAEWRRTVCPNLQISVNKSPAQFRRNGADWLAMMEQLGLPPESIAVEITESVLLENAPAIQDCLQRYRELGLQVALDDFGTGYSSLSRLKGHKLDYVKIDKSFVARLEDDADDLALCEAIIAMAHKLGMEVVAEGVETRVQKALLQDAGCDYAQGFIFSPPLPAASFRHYMLG